jgi:hypothetical protein
MKKYTKKDIQGIIKATGADKEVEVPHYSETKKTDEIMVKLLCNECFYLFKLANEMGENEFLKSGFAVRLTENMKKIWELTKNANREFMKEFDEKLKEIKE